MNTAMEYFERVKERDPAFPLAYAGIAQVWMFCQQIGLAPPDEAGPEDMKAIGRAVQPDSTFAELHLMMANKV